MIFVLFWISCLSYAEAQSGNGYSGYHWQISKLSFNSVAPPILITVIDSQGRRTGGDPSMPVGIHGQQGAHSKGPLAEIPFSDSDQENYADDSSSNGDIDQPTTSWGIEILDGGLQTYTVNLFGIILGVSEISISGHSKLVSGRVRNRFDILLAQGQTHQVSVTFDPTALTLTVQRIVHPEDLGTDVNTACQLNLISPQGICQSLKAKADSIVKDAQKNDISSETQHIQVFLKELQVTDKNHIQEPAFTILQDEAQALLNTLNSNQSQASAANPTTGPSGWNLIKDFLTRLTKIFS